MLGIDKTTRKCPNFMKAIIQLNNKLIPKLMIGINTNVNVDGRKLFGDARLTTTDLLFKNQFNMSTLSRHGYKYGFSYNATRDFSSDDNARIQASLEGDMYKNVSGDVKCKFTNDLMFNVLVQRKLNTSAVTSVLEWSSNRYNVNAELSVNSEIPGIVLTTSLMCRINDRWSVGNYFVTHKEAISGSRGDCWWSDMKPIKFCGALRYDGDYETVTAKVDQSANTTLMYQHRVNDALTVGAEMTADVTHKTARVTWVHRATLDGGLEIRGRLDTNGMIIGHLRKVFSSNDRGSFVVGISTVLNHRNGSMGLGIELELNMGTKTKE